ncbi:MAG: phosphotransferase [Labilithrix sp.]|nr:phosphotransferase [Labilithrix sp.]
MQVDEITEGGAALVEKRLSTRERAEPEAVARLRSESSLLERLSRIATVTPRLVARGEDERGPWFRAEKIAFPTLAARLACAPRGLEPWWIERAARAAFEALAALHESADADGPLGVVHADLSPANVAVDDAGARVVFFDLELASWREGPPRDGAFRGTARYVAPEIARGEAPRPASDLFGLAASLLHAMTGAPPRPGASLPAVLAAAAEDPLAVPAELAARGAAHAAVLSCLAFDPRARPRSAREVLAAMC